MIEKIPCKYPNYHTLDAQDAFIFFVNLSKDVVYNDTNRLEFNRKSNDYECAICWYLNEIDPKAIQKKQEDLEYAEKVKIESKKRIDAFLKRK